MYRIAVCDDNKVFVEKLCGYLVKWSKTRSLNADISHFHNGEDLLENIREYGYYQVVILDMEVGGMNGLILAKHIQKMCKETLIIFMSNSDHYYKQAYRVHPYYFFSKPIPAKELFSVMNGALVKSEIHDQAFRFSYKRTRYSIPVREIYYFFSDRRRIGVVCRNGKVYWFYGKLDQVEEIMATKAVTFIRIHQSFFVNSRQIRAYGYEYVEMADQEKLPVSRPRRKKLRRQLLDHAADI